MKQNDLRVIKTKQAIQKAFLQLLRNKELNDISISEIASTAMIDRKTFYAHYNGIFDLVDELEDEIVMKIGDLVVDIDAYDFLSDPKQVLYVLRAITEEPSFIFARAFTMKGNDKLLSKFVNTIKMLVVNELKSRLDLPVERLEVLVDFNISGMISCYQNWLRNGKKFPIESLSEELSMLAVHGLQGYLTKVEV